MKHKGQSIAAAFLTMALLTSLINPVATPTYAEGQTKGPLVEQAQMPTSTAETPSPRIECTSSMGPNPCPEGSETPLAPEIEDPMLPREDYTVTLAKGCGPSTIVPCEPSASVTYFGTKNNPADRRFSLLIYARENGTVKAHDFTVDHLMDAQETFDAFKMGMGVESR